MWIRSRHQTSLDNTTEANVDAAADVMIAINSSTRHSTAFFDLSAPNLALENAILSGSDSGGNPVTRRMLQSLWDEHICIRS